MSSTNPMDDIHNEVEEKDSDQPENFFVKSLAAEIEEKGIEAVTAALIPEEDTTGELPDIVMNAELEQEDNEVEEFAVIESDGTLPLEAHGFDIIAGKMMPKEISDDLTLIRDNLRNMIEEGTTSLKDLSVLAQSMEHPRVYEVLCNMMGTMKDLNSQLLSMNEKKHKMIQELEPAKDSDAKQIIRDQGGDVNVDKAIFVGSTSDLQKFFKEKGMSGANVVPAAT